MTLSNFDWTDKDSVKWFIMLPTGHEGPYSLNSIFDRCEKKALSRESKIWAEGLPAPLSIKQATDSVFPPVPTDFSPPSIPEDEIPPLPLEALAGGSSLPENRDEAPSSNTRSRFRPLYLGVLLGTLGMGIALHQWVSTQEHFSIRRYPKMSLELHGKIQKDLSFESWDKKIFFKEYVPADLSHVWLVTSSFQTCDIEASFQSIPGKLLTFNTEKIAFKSSGVLQNHVVEFSTFDFSSGNKIVPGLYEMDVRGKNCEWDGAAPRLANLFEGADETYAARTKVVLFPKGAVEFNGLLERLLRKKNEIEIKNQNQEDLFWQGLQEKFQTLLAISMQIEQHFLDLVDKGSKGFEPNLKKSVDDYTKKYGHFLTKFVVSNEDYFKQLSGSELQGISQKRNYEMLVKLTAKRLGFETMKIIEELQALKKPTDKQISPFEDKVKKTFKTLKEEINIKIQQVSEDRSA